MRIVSEMECWDWLKAKFGMERIEQGMHSAFPYRELKAVYPHCASYSLPIDTGKKTCIARELVALIGASEPGLFWITDWSVFPSCQNMALFEGYRKSLGETRSVGDAPGHVFDASDLKSIECLLDLALYFYWDASLFDGEGNIVLRTSHDECFDIYAKDKERLATIQSDLEIFDLR